MYWEWIVAVAMIVEFVVVVVYFEVVVAAIAAVVDSVAAALVGHYLEGLEH